MAEPTKSLKSSHETAVYLRSGRKRSHLSKCSIWVERQNFYGAASGTEVFSKEKPPKGRRSKHKHDPNEPFLVIGFDTEFKTPDQPLERTALYEGKGKYEVLSYQVYCKVFDPAKGEGKEWGGICYPENSSVEKRLSLSDIVTFAIWRGTKSKAVEAVPTKIYLVGHFTRADIPAFADFQTLTGLMSSVRNTFLSVDNHMPLEFSFADGGPDVATKILIRDTMLLTPAASKGLKALGELVGVEKVILDAAPEKKRFYKRNMDQLLQDDPVLFERYALTDAIICLRYIEQLIEQSRILLNHSKIPATLTSIGVDILWNSWLEKDLNPLAILGKEEVSERSYNKRLGWYERKTRNVLGKEVAWHLSLATECYHGGRNEQFWFGPGFEDDWTDYDLTSAYPTAMALIGLPDWKGARVTLNVDDFTPTTLGVCCVDFEFPPETRFPTLPVRTDNGLVFPLKGTSDCCAPEIALAKSLGATLKIRHGVIVPTSPETPVFFDFIKSCIAKRSLYEKKSLRNLFWKELSNSTYGKTAQGLHEKRVYDMRDRQTKRLPESRITNPYFAGYITSFVRAVLGDVINRLPRDVCVFSCTTDGFLTNASKEQMLAASGGELVAIYRQSRKSLTGDPNHLEPKHFIRRPLGWRTRGQCTLSPGLSSDDDKNILLAKGGIYLGSGLIDHSQKMTDAARQMAEKNVCAHRS